MCSYVTKDFRVLICVTCQQDISGNIPSCCVMLACMHGNPNCFCTCREKTNNKCQNTEQIHKIEKYGQVSQRKQNYCQLSQITAMLSVLSCMHGAFGKFGSSCPVLDKLIKQWTQFSSLHPLLCVFLQAARLLWTICRGFKTNFSYQVTTLVVSERKRKGIP